MHRKASLLLAATVLASLFYYWSASAADPAVSQAGGQFKGKFLTVMTTAGSVLTLEDVEVTRVYGRPMLVGDLVVTDSDEFRAHPGQFRSTGIEAGVSWEGVSHYMVRTEEMLGERVTLDEEDQPTRER